MVIVPDFLVDRPRGPVSRVLPGGRVIGISADGTLTHSAAGAIALLRYFPNDRGIGAFGAARIAELRREEPELRWVQSHGVGVDGLLNAELIESDLILTNGASLHTVPMAETVMALILAATKHLPEHVVDQQARTWRRLPKRELRGSTVGIVGMGRIGTEVARLCAARRC